MVKLMSIFNIANLSADEVQQVERPLIMLVDDEVENLNVLNMLLETDYEILMAQSGVEALKMIEQMEHPEKIKLIISDHRMPGLTGVEFLEKVVPLIPHTIRIILTGYSDTQAIIDSINKARLYKFMTKPFESVELKITVQRGIEAFDMNQELLDYTHSLEEKVKERTEQLEQALLEMEKITLTDQLTGANNRRFVQQFMEKEVAALEREYNKAEKPPKIDIGLVLIDVDKFKSVNDHYGHDAGDRVLVQIAQILRQSCRESDWIARWGGEEFLVVSHFVNREQQHHLAERIRANVAAYEFELEGGQTIRLTCSSGVTSIPFIRSDFKALSWQQSLNIADVGLYCVKNSGRNGWVQLTEHNIDDTRGFYDRAIDDLAGAVSKGQIRIQSSIADDKFKW